MHIEISIPRPLLTLSVIAGVVWVIADGIRDATPAVTASATTVAQTEPSKVRTHAAPIEESFAGNFRHDRAQTLLRKAARSVFLQRSSMKRRTMCAARARRRRFWSARKSCSGFS